LRKPVQATVRTLHILESLTEKVVLTKANRTATLSRKTEKSFIFGGKKTHTTSHFTILESDLSVYFEKKTLMVLCIVGVFFF
jgi:hypothetical protein